MAVRAYASGTRTRVSSIKQQEQRLQVGVLLKQSTGRMALVSRAVERGNCRSTSTVQLGKEKTAGWEEDSDGRCLQRAGEQVSIDVIHF